MEFGNVERFEVVIGRLDFRAFDDGEADGEEDVLDFLEDLADQVTRADGAEDAGEGTVVNCPSKWARTSAKRAMTCADSVTPRAARVFSRPMSELGMIAR